MAEENFTVRARIGEVVAMLGYLPPVIASVLAERNRDAADHHKRSLIKRAQRDFPGKRDAARFVASRLHGYGSKKRPCLDINDAQGESFAGAVSGESYGGKVFEQLEEGGTISAGAGLMFIPFNRISAKVRAKLGGKSLAADASLAISRTGLVFRRLKKRGSAGEATRVKPFGVLRNSRRQRPLLKFFATWEGGVQPRMVSKLDRDLDRAITVAGQEALGSELAALDRQLDARSGAFRASFEGFLRAEPGNRRGALKAALAAVREVQRDPIGQAKGGRA